MWNFKTHNYLKHELWEAISGYPTGMNVSNVTKMRSDQKALTKICLTLKSSAITHATIIRNESTAEEPRKTLQNAHEDKVNASAFIFRTEIIQIETWMALIIILSHISILLFLLPKNWWKNYRWYVHCCYSIGRYNFEIWPFDYVSQK